MELITVIGLVMTLCYIVRKMNASIQENKKENLEWWYTCAERYVKAVNYQPSCREVLRYQREHGR